MARAAAKKARKKTPAARPRRAGKTTAAVFRDGHIHEDDGECACDFEFDEAEATPDAMLPAARGGVEGDARRGSRRS